MTDRIEFYATFRTKSESCFIVVRLCVSSKQSLAAGKCNQNKSYDDEMIHYFLAIYFYKQSIVLWTIIVLSNIYFSVYSGKMHMCSCLLSLNKLYNIHQAEAFLILKQSQSTRMFDLLITFILIFIIHICCFR